MTYDEIRPNLRTGDIVLFSGKGGISEWIKFGSFSRWSHVGLVVQVDEWDMALLWESTTLSSIADLESGEKRQGVQLVPLSARIAAYDGEAAVRHIKLPLTDIQRNALRDFREAMKGRAYEASKMQLVRSLFDQFGPENVTDLSSLFCSEMVAEALMRMGLLDPSLPSNEYTPKDLSMDAKVPLATHGPEVMIA